MKKAVIIHFLLLFCINIFCQRQYEVIYNVSDFQLSEQNGIVSVTSCPSYFNQIGDTSYPQLPYYPLRILMPNNVSYSYVIEEEKTLLMSGVYFKANPYPITTNGLSLGTSTTASVSVLSPVYDGGILEYDNFSYLFLETTPFEYDSNTGNLYFVSRISISFPDMPMSSNTITWTELPPEYNNMMEMVVNPEDITDFYPLQTNNVIVTDTIDYLIITNNVLANSFSDLIQWKREKGLLVSLETLETIYNTYQGADIQLKIKECIRYHHDNHNTKWVLLGGDNTVVPTRNCAIYTNDSSGCTPSDLFYSCFQGSFNWDGNNNGIYGETGDNVVFNSTINISRIPVRTTTDVNNFTQKLLAYERDVCDTTAANRLLLTGFNIPNGSLADAKTYNDTIYNQYINPYWNGIKYYMYENENHLPDGASYNINSQNLKTEIDRGYNIIHEVSHGDYDRWIVGVNSFYTTSQASIQSNDWPSIILTNACMTNAFDKETCLSENLIRNGNGGAIAYFGSSREGWGGANGRIEQSFEYNGLFLKYLFTGNNLQYPYCFGEIARKAKMDMSELSYTNNPNRFLQLSINPIGDPEMQIFTDVPKTFLSNNPMIISPIIALSNNGKLVIKTHVPNSRIVALDENGVRKIKDNTSTAYFTGLSGLCKITILKHNYIPYQATINLNSFNNLNSSLIMNVIPISQNIREVRVMRLQTDYEENETSLYSCMNRWTITVRNIQTGNTLLSKEVNDSICRLNISTWASGVYAITASDGAGTVSTKIVVK